MIEIDPVTGAITIVGNADVTSSSISLGITINGAALPPPTVSISTTFTESSSQSNIIPIIY